MSGCVPRGLLLLSFAGVAAAAPPLPLKRLLLYDSGVAYFERSGKLDARGAALPVPTGHLDDVLKTLVVLSRDGGRLSGVEFNSSVSKGMARTLAGLPPEASAPIGYADLLASLKGSHVRVAMARESFPARLVDIQEEEVLEPVPRAEKAAAGSDAPPQVQPVKELSLLVLTDRSEVRRLRAKDVLSVQPTDPGFAGRLGAALDALSAHGAQAERDLQVSGTSGPVTLGYIAEAPLWRTTYRLVLAEGGKNLLQGWALLHNDTDEDWQGVRVELVNGRPDSFLYPLAVPRYTSRPLVTPENELSTVPQLLDTTVDSLWGDHLSGEGGAAGMSLGGRGATGSGYGSGGGALGGMVRSDLVAGGPAASDMLAVGQLAEVENAEGVEAGVLFTYRLADPLTLKARGSALVPFLQRGITAERVTYFKSVADAPRAGVRLANSTEQTLPAGPISVFAEGGFSGEASLDRLKPKEKRTLQFGADLDVALSQEDSSRLERVKRLVFRNEQLEEHYLLETDNGYLLENRSGQARTVHLALAVSENAKVKGADAIDFDGSEPVAIFHLRPRSKLQRTVHSVEGLSRATKLDAVSATRLSELAQAPELPEAERRIAKEAADRRAELERTRTSQRETRDAKSQVDADIARLREHLRALGDKSGASPADNPLVQRVLKAEDRLEALRKQEASLELDERARAEAVRAVLVKLAPPPKAPGPALSSAR